MVIGMQQARHACQSLTWLPSPSQQTSFYPSGPVALTRLSCSPSGSLDSPVFPWQQVPHPLSPLGTLASTWPAGRLLLT